MSTNRLHTFYFCSYYATKVVWYNKRYNSIRMQENKLLDCHLSFLIKKDILFAQENFT